MAVDYSLYLVTDSTPAILGEKRLQDVVEAAIEGGRYFLSGTHFACLIDAAGVTVVQYREKHSDTGDMIETAKDLLKVCQRHNVPLIINDRVDVALAIEAQGVHLGQTDMSRCSYVSMLRPLNTNICLRSCHRSSNTWQRCDYWRDGFIFITGHDSNR